MKEQIVKPALATEDRCEENHGNLAQPSFARVRTYPLRSLLAGRTWLPGESGVDTMDKVKMATAAASSHCNALQS